MCINNAEYPASLELHKVYRVLPDEDAREEGDLRIVDESGEDYLYPAEWFVSVNETLRRPALLEALRKLEVLKTTPYRSRTRGQVLLRIPGNRRDVEAWWQTSPDDDQATLSMKPYPAGWAELSATEQLEGLKDILIAIWTHQARLRRTAEVRQKSKRKRTRQ